MIKLIIIYLQENWNQVISPGIVGAGSYTVMMTGLNLFLKGLVALATLIYFGIKIYKEVKSK